MFENNKNYGVPYAESFVVNAVWEHLTPDPRSKQVVLRYSAELKWINKPWFGAASGIENSVDGEMDGMVKVAEAYHKKKIAQWLSENGE